METTYLGAELEPPGVTSPHHHTMADVNSTPAATASAFAAAPGRKGSAPPGADREEDWPKTHPDFDPLFDDLWPIRKQFCRCMQPDCEMCEESREVFHVAEYTASGRSVMDRKVNTQELRLHLQQLQLEVPDKPAAATEDYPISRLFFLCGNFVWDGPRFSHMRVFLDHCQMPPHLIIKGSENDVSPVFQAAYDSDISSAGDPTSTERPGVLHICIQTSLFISSKMVERHTEYYSADFRARHMGKAKGTFRPMCPTLYLRYDELSRETVAYAADSTMAYDMLRRAYSSARRADPFLVVAAFMQQRLTELAFYARDRRFSVTNLVSAACSLSAGSVVMKAPRRSASRTAWPRSTTCPASSPASPRPVPSSAT